MEGYKPSHAFNIASAILPRSKVNKDASMEVLLGPSKSNGSAKLLQKKNVCERALSFTVTYLVALTLAFTDKT